MKEVDIILFLLKIYFKILNNGFYIVIFKIFYRYIFFFKFKKDLEFYIF